MCQDTFAMVPLTKTKVLLTTYTGQTVPMLGELMVTVNTDIGEKELPLVICPGQGPPLLGMKLVV